MFQLSYLIFNSLVIVKVHVTLLGVRWAFFIRETSRAEYSLFCWSSSLISDVTVICLSVGYTARGRVHKISVRNKRVRYVYLSRGTLLHMFQLR